MQTVLVRDPRITINNPEDVEIIISQGGQRLTQYVQSADSNDTTQSNFSFQPPSTKTIVDRYMLLRVLVRVQAVGGTFDLGTATALRQLPLASIMETINFQINGGNVNDNISRRIHAMMRFNNDVMSRNRYLNKTASMPDQYLKYDDWLQFGSNRNPLASYGENSNEQTRGAFPFVSGVETVPGSNKYTELVYEITEPFFLSPLLNGLESHPDSGFVNVNQFDINIKWVSNLSRILSHVNLDGNALTGAIVTFVNTPQILVNYITPDNSYPLPMFQILPYVKFNDYPKNVGVKNAGESFQVLSDTIKLNQIPSHLFLFCKRSRNSESMFTSDVFARIDNVSILWNNESSVFSTYTKQGLFDISKRNGSNLLYSQWDKHTGSVFNMEFGVDLGLADGLSPSTMGQFTISAQVQMTNLFNEPVEYEFFICTLLMGSVEISENAFSQNLGLVTVPQVQEAEVGPEISPQNQALGEGQGGSFFTSAKKFINRLSRGAQNASRFVNQYAVPALSAINPALGTAVSGFSRGVGGLADVGRAATGGRISGGRLMLSRR